MKILSIKGRNLASIEGDFIIDFRSEPLRSAGIFAITGSTGSGKTTLLDAMCIALFYKSPRTYKAKTDKSQEREEDGIKENDCRSILRHGAGEGYAEVEFLALNGKEYRSRWSVNRARNKGDGNMQAARYELFCNSDNQFISKNKKENEETIVKLLGLNYEQFTRAVLLAQGEFSAFLKASPNEKAEILEKLTGTGIYTLISEKIYEKSKEAESALLLIEERMKGIVLLSSEECAQLQEEKEALESAAEKEEEALSVLNEKLKWIERSQYLEQEQEKAQKSVAQCMAAIEAMSDTIRILELTELIQPIRDTYTEAVRTRKKIEEELQQIDALGELLKQEKEQYDAAEKLLEECRSNKENTEKKKAEIEPLIIEATKIETECNSCRDNLRESEKQLKETRKALSQCEEQYGRSNRIIAANIEDLEIIGKWFGNHAIYSDIITRCEMISTSIADAKDAQLQIERKSAMLKDCRQQQTLFEQHLREAKEESERLKATLTLEIATLRRQLVEGAPCPVCGSLHHHTSQVTDNILKEEELEKARRENDADINRLTANIEKTKNEVLTLSASIEEYRKIYASRLEALLSIIGKLPEAANIINCTNPVAEIEEAAGHIERIASEWTVKKNRVTQLEQETALERNTLTNTANRIKELQSNLSVNEETVAALGKKIEEYRLQITAILGTAKSVGEISEYFRKEIEKLGQEFSHFTLKRNDLLLAFKKTEQSIENLRLSIDERKKKLSELNCSIEDFLAENKDAVTFALLEEVAKISAEECIRMRRSVTEARDRMLQANTQLSERMRNIEQHAQATVKPADNEDKEAIQAMLQESRQFSLQRKEKITQITVKLKSDKENKQRTEKLRKEYAAAEEYSTDWKKLCDIFGAAKGQKFRMIAQGYTLDIMLSYANIHLKQLSSRYQLVRSAPDSLALTIIDLDMLSERRTVNTLSGGETFLVSLALALALSSLSSSNMSIESLFIDEGFGSLDSDTLRIAMEALEHLQSQGRKIGVISHLSNMIERIPTQICVTKKRGGKSTVEVKQQF